MATQANCKTNEEHYGQDMFLFFYFIILCVRAHGRACLHAVEGGGGGGGVHVCVYVCVHVCVCACVPPEIVSRQETEVVRFDGH